MPQRASAWQPSLTARLVAGGALASLLPFMAAALLVLVAPGRVLDRAAGDTLAQQLEGATIDLGVEREELRDRLAAVPDRDIAAAVRRRDATAVLRKVGVADAMAQFRTGSPVRAADGPLVAYAQVGNRALVLRRPVSAAVLAPIARRRGITLHYVPPGRHANTSDGAQARALQPRGSGTLVAHVPGSRLAQLARARGVELGLLGVLLLAVGLSTAVAAALAISSALARLADRAQHLAAGDYHSRLPVHGRDAGARVAESFNSLAADLETNIGQLRLTLDRLDRTLEAIEDGVCLWGADDEVLVWNRAAEELTGVEHGELVPGNRTHDWLAGVREVGHQRVLLPIADADGQPRERVLELRVTHTRQGGRLQVFRDCTRELAIEEARTNFLVTAAHELRTPLVPLLGFLPILNPEHVDPGIELREQAWQEVDRAALRLADVVDALVSGSLLARSALDVTIGTYDLGALVAAARDHVGRDIDVRLEVDGRLQCDRSGMVRALAELLDNADKYGRAPIVIHARSRGELLEVRIRDQGPGIPHGEGDRLFEPFTRLDPDMRGSVGGVGLGLYTARRLLEAMGGSLELEGRSTLLIILPGSMDEGVRRALQHVDPPGATQIT